MKYEQILGHKILILPIPYSAFRIHIQIKLFLKPSTCPHFPRNQYSHFLPGDSHAYKFPEQHKQNGHFNFVDLSIYHPKYGGRYNDHVPLDLAHFYCTLSQADFPFMKEVWRFASAQKMANKIGPLGQRAGAVKKCSIREVPHD